MSELTPEDASSTFAATPPLESLKFMLSRCMTGKRRAPAEECWDSMRSVKAHFHSPARRTIVANVLVLAGVDNQLVGTLFLDLGLSYNGVLPISRHELHVPTPVV